MADFTSFAQGVYTNDSTIVGTPTLVPGTIGLSVSANLEGTGTAIVGLINPGSYNATLSTVGVAFNYTGGVDGLAKTTTRTITLSSHYGVNTTFTTRISGAFDCATMYKDRTSSFYTVTANSAMARSGHFVSTEELTVKASDPNTARLVTLGYL